MDGDRQAQAVPVASEVLLSELGRICQAFKITSLLPQIHACEAFSRRKGEVDVALLGQFKAGKSSFLNSLVGKQILPVDVLPATAVVTRLSFGEADGARVRFLSGNCEEISPDALAAYVTESQNPANEKEVDTVDVELAALAPYRGIRFVDTPGFGSIHTHNTQASMNWLPRVGGALLAVSSTQPFGELDMRLLQDLSRHTPEVALLLTKVDLLTEGQLESVVEFTQFQATQHTGRQYPVLPFSTHPAHGERLRAVREYLLREIVARHQALFARILGHKLRATTEACRAYLLLAHRAAHAAAEARSELGRLIRDERQGLRAVEHEMAVLSLDLRARVRSVADERFQRFRSEITMRLRSALRMEMAGWTGNLARRSERFQVWLEISLLEEMSRVSAHGSDFLGDFLPEVLASLQRLVRSFQDRLGSAVEQALGITFEGARFHAEMPEPHRPDVRVGAAFDTHVDLLWFLIPMGVFGPLFERHFLGLLPWEVEKHLSRLAHQWAVATDASIEGLVSQAMGFVREELDTLEGLATAAEDRRQAIREALDTLDAFEGQIP